MTKKMMSDTDLARMIYWRH